MSSDADTRLAEIEAEIARLKGRERQPTPQPKVNSMHRQLSDQIAARMQANREARARRAAEQAERERRRAERDAPKRAKRDAQLKVYDDQIAELNAEQARLAERITTLWGERVELARREL